MKWYHGLVILLIILTYLVFRLAWQNTIEFGYDQPRMSTLIQEFLRNGSYLTSQEYNVVTAWGTPAWGPFMVFFFATFIKISSDPYVLSSLLAIFNLASIVIVMYIGLKYFSIGTGLVAGLILTTQPWWIIFSRMIYQPTPIPTLIAVSMLLTFMVLESNKKQAMSWLILVWTIMFQTYFHAIAIVATSAAFLLLKIRQLSIKWVLLGILLSSVFIFPTIRYFYNNPGAINLFLGAPGKYATTLREVVTNYFNVVSGSGFIWQLGNGYSDFVNQYPYANTGFTIGLVFISVVLGSNLIMIVRSDDRLKRSLLIFWAIAPIWFITVVKVEKVVPRYFLTSLPAMSLLVGIFIDDMKRLLPKKVKNSIYIIPVGISIMWLVFILGYFKFIQNYSYPNGFLSNFSDTPYSFIVKSMDWVKTDSEARGARRFNVTSDSLAVGYYLDYVDNTNGRFADGLKYEISYNRPDMTRNVGARFGPMTIYRLD